jgi:hypothetical protein
MPIKNIITKWAVSMLYKKEFAMSPYGGAFLKNPEPAIAYVKEKIDKLLKTKDDHAAQRDVKCQIFSDFKTIYDYDLNNAIFPEPFGTFASQEAKEQLIKQKLLYEDFQLYLGDIFVNYHCELAKERQMPTVDASPFVIDYNELVDIALAEYVRVLLRIPHPVQIRRKDITVAEHFTVECRGMELSIPTGRVQRQVHACAATFILPSLIEHYLLLYLENTVISQWINGMSGKRLNTDEAALYQKFLDMKKIGHGIMTGDRKTTMERIWDMGIKYSVFPEDCSMKEILCGRGGNFITLGTILKSTYARTRIKAEYLQILDYMFGKKLLNLRNSIAHGISTNYDYLSLAFVGIMVQMIWDISTNDVILGYEFE